MSLSITIYGILAAVSLICKNRESREHLLKFPDHPQNWTPCSFGHSRLSHKISERSFHNFLSYLANTQTDKQTNKLRQKHNLLDGGNKHETKGFSGLQTQPDIYSQN